jgi:hypothetical protein
MQVYKVYLHSFLINSPSTYPSFTAFLPVAYTERSVFIMLAQNPHDITLPTFVDKKVKISAINKSKPQELAQTWLDKFALVLSSRDASSLSKIIHNDSWWRDYLTLTWDFRTIRSVPRIIDFLAQNINDAGMTNLRLQKDGKFAPSFQTPIEGLEWVESMFHYETKVGRGKGFLRLAQGDDGAWKAHFISTSLQELIGHEDPIGPRRPHGGKSSLQGGMVKGNWQERRDRQKEFIDAEPDVFIVGAGKLILCQVPQHTSGCILLSRG